MSQGPRTFQAKIVAGRGGGAMVEIPFSVEDAYGTRGQVMVKAAIDGQEYRGSVAPMGQGVHILGVRKAIRQAIGKDVGDLVTVSLERDTEARVVKAPPELAAALRADAEAQRRYDALSYTHRREFAEWVREAKKQETRDRRATRAILMLRAGETR